VPEYFGPCTYFAREPGVRPQEFPVAMTIASLEARNIRMTTGE
jgi:hypothetical protein